MVALLVCKQRQGGIPGDTCLHHVASWDIQVQVEPPYTHASMKTSG